MLNQNFGDFAAFGKMLTGPLAELHALNSRVFEQFTKEVVEKGSNNLAASIKHMQTSFKTKEAEEFVKLQMEYMAEMSSKCLNYSKDLSKIFECAFKDYRKFGEDNAAELLKKAGLSTECSKKTS